LLSKRHRDLGRLKTKAGCRLHALLLQMNPGGAAFRITPVSRINAVIDAFEAADVMGRERQEIARKLAADTDRYKDLLDASKQCITVALGTSLTRDTLGRAFSDRKVAERKTSTEAIRALKRRLSDVVYRHLVLPTPTNSTDAQVGPEGRNRNDSDSSVTGSAS
jgi:hypothetical protein